MAKINLKKLQKKVTDVFKKTYHIEPTDTKIEGSILVFEYNNFKLESWEKPFQLELAFNSGGLFLMRLDMFDIKNKEKTLKVLNDLNYQTTYLKALTEENSLTFKYYVGIMDEKDIFLNIHLAFCDFDDAETVKLMRSLIE